jgi:formylglycine-generating enzyme required for sulfatase activity
VRSQRLLLLLISFLLVFVVIGRGATPPSDVVEEAGAAMGKAVASRKECSHRLELPVEITNSIGMRLKLMPAGEFMMGTPESDNPTMSHESPQHKVRITKPFYLGVYEVTQAEYARVMGENPSRFKDASNPVEQVSWDDATEFCRKLSAKEGKTYRLPTEAEWEYACRAGTTTRYSFGDDWARLGEYAWYGANSRQETHPVGEKKPNA